MPNGEHLLESLAEGPLELAVLASLAGRVESQLLRALRLSLAPTRSAADEADLWFSQIVEVAAASGMVFFPEVVPELQRRLALDRHGRLEPAWRLLFRLRTTIDYADRHKVAHPTWLTVQEELTYWALRGGPETQADHERVSMLYAWVENSLADPRLAADAMTWIKAVQLRLPVDAWSLPGATSLARAASGTIQATRTVWVRRVSDGMELSLGHMSGAHRIDTVAPLGPIRVKLAWDDDQTSEHDRIIHAGSPIHVVTDAPAISIYLSDGQSFRLVSETPADRRAHQAACVAIIGGPNSRRGCGVLVSPRYVLTCDHVLEAEIPKRSHLPFGEAESHIDIMFPFRPHADTAVDTKAVYKGTVIARSTLGCGTDS